mgnify:FL=1
MTLREKIMEMVNDRRELLKKKISECENFKKETEHNATSEKIYWRYFLESWEDHIFNEFMYRNTKDLSGLATEWIIECRLIEAAREIQSYVMVLADVAGNEINNEIRKMLGEGK